MPRTFTVRRSEVKVTRSINPIPTHALKSLVAGFVISLSVFNYSMSWLIRKQCFNVLFSLFYAN